MNIQEQIEALRIQRREPLIRTLSTNEIKHIVSSLEKLKKLDSAPLSPISSETKE